MLLLLRTLLLLLLRVRPEEEELIDGEEGAGAGAAHRFFAAIQWGGTPQNEVKAFRFFFNKQTNKNVNEPQ